MEPVGRTQMPLFPLDLVLVPGLVLPLHIFEMRYRALLRDALAANPMQPEFGIIAVDPFRENGVWPGIHRVGTSVRITEVEGLPDGTSNITVVGQRRFEILSVDDNQPYLVAEIRWLDEDAESAASTQSTRELARRAAGLFRDYRLLITDVDENADALADADDDPQLLSYILVAAPMLPTRVRQQLLECESAQLRLTAVCEILAREVTIMRAFPSLPWSPDVTFASDN